MLLNVLSGNTDSYRWSHNEFYNYLSFLKKSNLPSELLDIIANVYTAGNIDIYNANLLDGIDVQNDYNLARGRIRRTNGGYYQNR